MGFTALVAAAPTARGASWLAHAGSEALIADPAALEGAVAGLPVRVMTGDAAVREALAAIGATRVGDVIALPRGGLARRFGPKLLDDLDRALGRAPDPRTFFTPPAEFRARLELPAEVTQTEALLFAAKRLFVQLEGFLAARAGGVQRLALRLFHREARFTDVPIGLVAPARDAAHFTLLARERLGRLALPEAVRAIALDAGDVVPLAGEALALFDDGASAPGDWQKLVERLRARLGGAAVHYLAVAEEHRPERASRECVAGTRPPATDADRCAQRPFWLLPAPQPLEEIDAAPQRGGPLKLLAGPERIESGWWDGGDVARDYYVAETAGRTLVWVFRERRPRAAGSCTACLRECCPPTPSCTASPTSASCAAPRTRRNWSSAPPRSATRRSRSPTNARSPASCARTSRRRSTGSSCIVGTEFALAGRGQPDRSSCCSRRAAPATATCPS